MAGVWQQFLQIPFPDLTLYKLFGEVLTIIFKGIFKVGLRMIILVEKCTACLFLFGYKEMVFLSPTL